MAAVEAGRRLFVEPLLDLAQLGVHAPQVVDLELDERGPGQLDGELSGFVSDVFQGIPKSGVEGF